MSSLYNKMSMPIRDALRNIDLDLILISLRYSLKLLIKSEFSHSLYQILENSENYFIKVYRRSAIVGNKFGFN